MKTWALETKNLIPYRDGLIKSVGMNVYLYFLQQDWCHFYNQKDEHRESPSLQHHRVSLRSRHAAAFLCTAGSSLDSVVYSTQVHSHSNRNNRHDHDSAV